MLVHVLLYEIGDKNEGIHSIELNGKTIVLMFENKDDAERYCGLLEAQDFPKPTIEAIEESEIDSFCKEAGYESRFVEKGFIPKSEEDRLLIAPPEKNLDFNLLDEHINDRSNQVNELNNNQLDTIRNQLENLL
ncbi:DUF3110 domain-containing protein [Prochlorococcus marinus]|uniref:DUF3110 domain-containing protein n=1 Tax=Prochlorococcus marinus TaxID=1219 RepID=UPI0022B47B03|nr:DUF3110 domain-containing protein [Prochlorococcus marinus]